MGLRARIKAELVPGERLLWAARAITRRPRPGVGYLVAGLISGFFLALSAVAIASLRGAFGRAASEPACTLIVADVKFSGLRGEGAWDAPEGFDGIAEVRRVEELLRRTLVDPGPSVG